MKKTIEVMAQLYEKNNIPLLDGRKKKDGGLNSENSERCHALVAVSSRYSSFIIDSGASRDMDFTKDSFSALH